MTVTWRGKLKFDPGLKLWVRQNADELAREIQTTKWRRGLWNRGRKKTIYNAYGRAVGEVNVHDSGNSEHEFDDHQDAVVRAPVVKVDWSMAEKHIDPAVLAEIPDVEVASADYRAARAKWEAAPTDPEVAAEWMRAKERLRVARMHNRLARRRI
jgi:hypothetical protein